MDRLSMIEPRYGETWLRAWAAVLEAWPGRVGRSSPTLTVVEVGPYWEGVAGHYHTRRDEVTVFVVARPVDEPEIEHERDRVDALCTLIHEYAHAWAPVVRGAHDHGPRWRSTYMAIAGWLLDGTIDLAYATQKYRDLRDSGDEYAQSMAVDGSTGFYRRVADMAVTSAIFHFRPRVTYWDHSVRGPNGALLVDRSADSPGRFHIAIANPVAINVGDLVGAP